MIRGYIVEFGPLGLVFVFLVFAAIKLRMIYKKRLEKDALNLFVVSLLPIGKQGLKNIFQEKLKKYYKSSNIVNYVFYVVFALCGLVYFLMKSI